MTILENESTIEASPAPDWFKDMEFCHIGSDDTMACLCGYKASGECGGIYEGEAICPVCNCPTCPRCAQLCALEENLDVL